MTWLMFHTTLLPLILSWFCHYQDLLSPSSIPLPHHCFIIQYPVAVWCIKSYWGAAAKILRRPWKKYHSFQLASPYTPPKHIGLCLLFSLCWMTYWQAVELSDLWLCPGFPVPEQLVFVPRTTKKTFATVSEISFLSTFHTDLCARKVFRMERIL